MKRFDGALASLVAGALCAACAGEVGEPTEEQLTTYYDNHQAKFTQPEYR